MTSHAEFEAAADEIQRIIERVVENGRPDVQSVRKALSLLPHVRNVLLADAGIFKLAVDEESYGRVLSAASRAGDVALMRAVLNDD